MRQDILPLADDPALQVDALLANDDRALAALYQRNYDSVESYVLKHKGSAVLAKDIYQEAFIACWTALQSGSFAPRPGTTVDGFLYRIAQHKWIDYLRTGYHRKTVFSDVLPEQDNEMDDELPGEQDVLITAVKANFDKLGGSCKDVLTRFYFRRETLRTIAAALNWTEATARNNKYRCIQQLRNLISQ